MLAHFIFVSNSLIQIKRSPSLFFLSSLFLKIQQKSSYYIKNYRAMLIDYGWPLKTIPVRVNTGPFPCYSFHCTLSPFLISPPFFSGDMLLFYNRNASAFSLAIKFFRSLSLSEGVFLSLLTSPCSDSKWSHCAMVVRKEDGTMWLAEATQSSNLELFPLGFFFCNLYLWRFPLTPLEQNGELPTDLTVIIPSLSVT